MKRLAKFALQYRFLISFIFLLLFFASLFFMKKLRVNNDIVSFLNHSDPDVKLFTYLGDRFGSSYIDMVVLKAEDHDIFSKEHINTIRLLTESLERLKGVDRVISLTNVLDVRKVEDGLEVDRLIKKKNLTSKELRKLKSYVLGKDMFRGSIISSDGSITTLAVRLKGSADKQKLSSKIEKTTEKVVSNDKNLSAFFGGMPSSMYHANIMLNKDLSSLIPFVAFLIVIVLFLSFYSLKGVLLPLITVVLATTFSIGMMGLLNVPLTMLSSILPVVLLSTGTAYGIHLINADREQMIAGVLDPDQRMKNALDRVGLAILLSALTTLFGFASLVSAELIPIRQFGIFVAIGVLYALIITLFAMPGVISTWGNRSTGHHKTKSTNKRGILSGLLESLAGFITENRIKTVVISIIIAILAIMGIPKIKREVNFSRYFPKNSTIRKAQTILERHFGGADPIVVYFKAEDIKHPAVLKVMSSIKKAMRSVEGVKNPKGIVDFIEEMNYIMNDRRKIPTTIRGLENLWLFIEGKKELDQMISKDKKEAIIQATAAKGSSTLMVRLSKLLDSLIKSIPKRYTKIDLSKLSKKTRKEILFSLTNTLRMDIFNDLLYSGIDIENSNSLYRMLVEASIKIPEDRVFYPILNKNLKTYLMSDTSEIEFDNQAVSKLIADLNKLNEYNKDRIKKTIFDIAPIEIKRDDPDAINSMTDSIERIWQDSIDDAKVKEMLDLIDKASNKRLRSLDKTEISRIEGDLYSLTDDIQWIPEDVFTKIFHKKPSEVINIQIKQSGLVKILSNIEHRLLLSQMESLGLSIFLVFILLVLQLRSITMGLISIIPISFTILVNFGVMGHLGISLDHATMMIASISIGIGVDYTIHIISRFNRELKEKGDLSEAIKETLSTTGRAVIVNTASVAMGFFVLAFSKFEPTRRFGYLTTMTMFLSALSAITILPAAVLLVKKKRILKAQH